MTHGTSPCREICDAGRLNELVEQIESIEGKIHTLGSSTHPLAVEANALFPEIDELRSWLPLFRGRHPKGAQPVLSTCSRQYSYIQTTLYSCASIWPMPLQRTLSSANRRSNFQPCSQWSHLVAG